MVITNYKDIIVVDNFITSEESDIFVSLIEKPKCYESNSYWRFLSSDNTVAPLALNYFGNEIYSSVLERVNDVSANNAYIDVKKRILRLLENKYKVEHSGLEKFSDYVPYICDKEMPVDGSSLGIPASEADDHSGFLESQAEWGLTNGGNRNYIARIFINHDFKGGNLTFPQHKLDIKPAKDRLVLYPCSKDYIYGVRNIDGGSFYLTFWFTKA